MKSDSWNPLLKSYPDSDKINAVSIGAETLYTRLIAQSDDAAHYYGNTRWIIFKLFTARGIAGQVTENDIAGWIKELESVGLIERYLVDGQEFIELIEVKKCLRSDVKKEIRFPSRDDAKTHTGRTRNEHVTNPGRVRNESGPLDPDPDPYPEPEDTQKNISAANAAGPYQPTEKSVPETEAKPKQNTPVVRKPRKEPTGEHSALVKYFCDRWQERYGLKYPFADGKDGSHIRRILGHVDKDLSRAKRIVDSYIEDDDKFYVDDRHSIGLLLSQIRKFLVDSADGGLLPPLRRKITIEDEYRAALQFPRPTPEFMAEHPEIYRNGKTLEQTQAFWDKAHEWHEQHAGVSV